MTILLRPNYIPNMATAPLWLHIGPFTIAKQVSVVQRKTNALTETTTNDAFHMLQFHDHVLNCERITRGIAQDPRLLFTT